MTLTWGLPWMQVWLGYCQPDSCRPRRFCFLHQSLSCRSFRADILRRLCTRAHWYSLSFSRALSEPHIDRPANHSAIAFPASSRPPHIQQQHQQQQRPIAMCLVKVKQEEDVVVPYRVVSRHNHSPPRRRASRHSTRYSREVIRSSHHESPRPSASYVAVPTPQPKPLAIPPPQPVPVFVEPPPAPIHVPAAPPPPRSHGAPQYVEVSPRSSFSSRSSSPNRSEYVYREREVRRERAYSPDRGPQYEHYRYVEPARSESSFGGGRGYARERSRSRVNVGYGRERSRSRGSYVDERTRVTIVDDDGRRRSGYR